MYSSVSCQKPPDLRALCGTVHFSSLFLPSNSDPKRYALPNTAMRRRRFSRAANLRGQQEQSSGFRVLFPAQLFLRHVELALHIPQFRLETLDVLNRELHRARFAVALLLRGCPGHDDARASRRSIIGSAIFADYAVHSLVRRLRWREQRGNLLKRHVDAIPPTLLGDFMRGPFGREVSRKSFGIRNARKMRALQDVLIIRLGRQEQSRSLGAHDS